MKTALILIFVTMTAYAQENAQTNKHFWCSIETTANPEEIWSIWTDVPSWKDWDVGLKNAVINEPFEKDAKGYIISLEDRTSKFRVIEFVKGKSYTFKTKLPLGSIYIKRYLKINDGATVFTHEVWFEGLTAGIFSKSFGSKFRKMLPIAMQNIKEIAESK